MPAAPAQAGRVDDHGACGAAPQDVLLWNRRGRERIVVRGQSPEGSADMKVCPECRTDRRVHPGRAVDR